MFKDINLSSIINNAIGFAFVLLLTTAFWIILPSNSVKSCQNGFVYEQRAEYWVKMVPEYACIPIEKK